MELQVILILFSCIILAFGEYKWKTFKQFYDDCEALAKYLLVKDLCPKIETSDGLFRFIGI
jgi:hypothetical protein